MARKTKNNENLTMKEKLEQALIPNWDEPYKLPDNWCWVALSALTSVISKGTTPTGGKHAYLDNGIPFLRVENINDDGTISHESIIYVSKDMHLNFLRRSILEPDDILVSIAGTLGKTGIVREIDIPLNTNQAIAFVRLNRKYIYPKYIKYCIDNPVVQTFLLAQAKVTAIPNLTLEIVSNCPIPLAPLPEQKRIVERIENLFAKLDEAKEKAQEIIDGFENRRAAILHKAFSGELTAKWREKNGISMDTWESSDLQSVCIMKITDGTHKTPDYSDSVNGFPFLSAKDVTKERIDWDNIKYITPELHKELYTRLAPKKNDVLLAKNGTTGVAAIVDVDKVFDLYVTLAVLRPDDTVISPKYLYRIINSPICKVQFNEHLTGIGVPNLHLRDIKKVIIPIPTLCEQDEIVQILDSILPKEKLAKELAEKLIIQINTLKKSILASAFRGELGTNDPNDENAVELLKQILEGSDDKPKEKKSASRLIIPKNISEQLSSELEKKIIKSILKNNGKADINAIMSVSSKKFDVMDAIKKLEDKNLIIHDESGEYILKG